MKLELQEATQRAETNVYSKTVLRAFEILEALDSDTPELGIRELSRKIGEPKSSVQRLVATLVHIGVLEQNPATERYRIGFRLFELGARWLGSVSARDRIHQYLTQLVEETKETAYVAIADNRGGAVYIDKVQSPQTIRTGAPIGQRVSLSSSAIGRALLAYMSSNQVEEILREPVECRTPKTITDPEKLRETLAISIEQGYFLDDEESEIGLRCIAVPVLAPDRTAVASICVSGPSSRITLERVSEIACTLRKTAETASGELVYLLEQDGRLT
ncbi:MAG: IclR family transcriptional regulator [Ardenticatenaceae bacterium]|nr:IclR family transcriptional regulator [Ardenticatenaceae bacterium]HBY93376.1 IclR family transcriptional regulator [Chloroflexota bacterium]